MNFLSCWAQRGKDFERLCCRVQGEEYLEFAFLPRARPRKLLISFLAARSAEKILNRLCFRAQRGEYLEFSFSLHEAP